MSSYLSKYGVIDQNMVGRLRIALAAREAFPDASNARQEDSLRMKETETVRINQSLESRLRKSQSPMLVILQLLHEEPAIGSCIASFLGAWAPALRVVIAEKPRIKKESKAAEAQQGGAKTQDDENGSEDDGTKSEEAAEAVREGQEHPLHGRLYQTSQALLRTKSLPSDAHDPAAANRVKVNAKRARLVRDLLAVRAAKAEESEQHVQKLMLLSFWTHKGDGDPNRLLIDYWLSKMSLASKYFRSNDAEGTDRVVDSAGVEHMDESAAASLFGKMQKYSREKRALQTEHRALALRTREAFKKELKEAETQKEAYKEEVKRRFMSESEEAKERVKASIVNMNKRPGEDGVPPSVFAKPSHPSLLLPTTDRRLLLTAKIRKVEERLRKVGADLAYKRREMSREVTELIETSKAVMPDRGTRLLAQEISEEHDKAERRKEALSSVKDAFKEGTNAFYIKLAEKMANSAQSSLEAIDRKFVESGVFDSDHGELFEDLQWNVAEKKRLVETAENGKRTVCSELTDDVESRMQSTNKALFALELDRVERLQQFKESKTVKSRGASPGKR